MVRIAAIKALGRVGGIEGLALLLEQLPKEKGRAAWEVSRALNRITGRNFGIDSNQWTKWWKGQASGFVPPELKSSLWEPKGARKGRYGFYGLSIDSHHTVFVLDVSGSMQGGRIRRLRQELTRALQGMTGQDYLNMIFFNSSVWLWKKSLVPMGGGRPDYRAEAITKARYLRAGGNTNLYGALTKALSQEEADSILLLSDGDPTVGELVDKNAILKAVQKLNRVMQITIHVIAIGDADHPFLRELALSSGGTFRGFRSGY
jgi:hypothetical protein